MCRLDPTFSAAFFILETAVWLLCTTMIIYRLHFVYIILLLVNFSFGQKTFVTRAAHDIHQIAVHHTHNLARDLRIAFGGYFIRRANNKRVVYCKRAEQSPLVNGGPVDGGPVDGGPVDGGPANVSSSKSHSTATQSSSTLKPTPTQSSSTPKPTPTSPWKLTNSYVRPIGLLTLFSTNIYFSFFP